MPMTAEDRKMFDRLNKRYKVFKKRGVTSNTWELIKNELLNVYMDASDRGTMDISRINFKQNVFSLSKNIDEQTLEKMRKIARFAEDTKSSSFAYYNKSKGQYDEALYKQYQSIKQQKGFFVDDLQDYIDFIDDIENGAMDSELFERLGSKLYRYFQAYCKHKKVTKQEYNDIVSRGLATQLSGDPLYNWLRDEVDLAYSKRVYEESKK